MYQKYATQEICYKRIVKIIVQNQKKKVSAKKINKKKIPEKKLLAIKIHNKKNLLTLKFSIKIYFGIKKFPHTKISKKIST